MNSLPHDHIIPLNQSGETKKEKVREMFNRISGSYDRLNRFLSARTDVGWRKKAIRKLKQSNPREMLDVASC